MMWIHERISAVRDEHDERRVRTRVHVSAEIEVAGAHGLREALLTDLSRAGARLVSREAIGAVGETIELFLPNPRGEEIGVMGEITRSDEGPGGHTVSVRFSLVEPARQKTLEDLIGVLVAGGGGHRRKHARVARRIEVAYGSPRRIFALLGDSALKQSQGFIDLSTRHQEFLRAFRTQDWNTAKALNFECERMNSAGLGRLYALYRERIAYFRHNPPPPDWDGSTEALSK